LVTCWWWWWWRQYSIIIGNSSGMVNGVRCDRAISSGSSGGMLLMIDCTLAKSVLFFDGKFSRGDVFSTNVGSIEAINYPLHVLIAF
jgi:hypothetical protein